jgi:hypothetical protein
MKMKKFTIIGMVLAIIAVGVFLACAQVPTKTKSGLKYFKIKVNTQTGEVFEKLDQNNKPPKELKPWELQAVYLKGPIHIGEILFTHSSPGCVYIVVRGKAYEVCT